MLPTESRGEALAHFGCAGKIADALAEDEEPLLADSFRAAIAVQWT